MTQLEGVRLLITGGSGFIGSNLTSLAKALGAEVVNLDVRPPLDPSHTDAWVEGDVCDSQVVKSTVEHQQSTVVVHMAARTDTDSEVRDEYQVNVMGTQTVLNALDSSPDTRLIHVSTQFVLGPSTTFKSFDQYAPHTAYGASKVEAERVVKRAQSKTPWAIVRPTNVWGPWHERYQREFWHVLQKGLYFQASTPDPIRSYGYVGSVCSQIARAMSTDWDRARGETFYVGDEPIRLSEWTDAFSNALRGSNARRVPRAAMSGIAWCGEILDRIGLDPPINRSRYRSMIQDYPVPMGETLRVLGTLGSVPLDQGVRETTVWLNTGKPPAVDAWV